MAHSNAASFYLTKKLSQLGEFNISLAFVGTS